MSIEDREWQKERDRKRLQEWMGEEDNQKILASIYNPKEFRSRKNRNQFSTLKKLLIVIILISLIFTSYLSENGLTFTAIKTKIELK